MDPDFPKDITTEEANAGFTLQDLHPGYGLPQYAVVLYVGENRIIKARKLFGGGGGTIYAFQSNKEVPGQRGRSFADGVIFENLQDALRQARLHSEFGQ